MSFAGMKRLSAQSLGPDDRVVEAVRRGQPAVFKVVNPDAGWVEKLHEASPDTVLIGRIVDNTLKGEKLCEKEGKLFAERVLRKAEEFDGLVKWWEGSNESAEREGIKRLCEFERAFAEKLQAEGYHALVGGFSRGIPEIVGPDGECPWMEEWEWFYPAMEVAHGVHFHEYWWPDKLDDTWTAYRFLKWWPALPEWAKSKWWLVSELGVDGGPRQDEKGHYGWRDYADTSAPRYLELLKGYAQTMAQYPRLAAAIYVAGLAPERIWHAFDICGEVLDHLSDEWATAPAETWGSLVAEEPEVLVGYLKVGIDANAPINVGSGTIEGPSASPHILAGTGARWARLNFILGPWSHPDDPQFKATYQNIIQGFINAWGGEGPQIYGLVGHEAAHRGPRNLLRFPPLDVTWALPGYTNEHKQTIKDFVEKHFSEVGETPDEWITRYVDHFAAIVRDFHDQVHLFEMFNEPDDWHHLPPGHELAGDNLNPWGHKWGQAWVHPYWLARMLEAIYQRVKPHAVKIITGPLQGLGEHWATPASYLRNVYDAGRRLFDWGDGEYPFHGIGYHLYVHEGFNPNKDEVAENIRDAYGDHLDCIEGVIKDGQCEGPDSERKLYISEFGWPTPNPDSEEEQAFQAHAMHTAFDILKEDPRIALAIWFCTQDFPGKKYGLYKMGDLGPDTQKKEPFRTFRICTEAKEPVAVEAQIAFQGAEQAFEHGRMIWRGDKVRIYVLYDDNTWADYEDTYDSATDPVKENLQAPAGLQEPAFGFGKVWRKQPGVRERIGWAKGGEAAIQGKGQRLAGGEKLWTEEKVYTLRDDGTFLESSG
jgi:hypothetical protein